MSSMYNIYSIAKLHEMHTTHRGMGKLKMSSTQMEIFLQFLPSHLLDPLNKHSRYTVLRGRLTILFLHTAFLQFRKLYIQNTILLPVPLNVSSTFKYLERLDVSRKNLSAVHMASVTKTVCKAMDII